MKCCTVDPPLQNFNEGPLDKGVVLVSEPVRDFTSLLLLH